MIHTFNGISPAIHETSFVAPGARIIGDVEVHGGASIWYNCVLRGDAGKLIVGANTNIQDGAILHGTSGRQGAEIGANVVFGPGAYISEGATIHPFCHIEGATIGAGAQIGPFARLRPGAHMCENSKAGNFVEIKKSVIGKGSKINHLSYIGDAEVGEGANVGAGTITCNYDGYNKHKTTIGDGAFVGTNSSLVAPITIGAGAYLGSGGVITEDVPADALALGRAKQANKEGWAKRYRAAQEKRKQARKT